MKKSKKEKPKICFVSPTSYILLFKENMEMMGGSELQQILLASELVKNGYDISFLSYDVSTNQNKVINDIKIFEINRAKSKKWIISWIYNQLAIWNAMKFAEGDIYYCRGFGFIQGLVALFSFFKKKKTVFLVANDMDIDGTRLNKVNFLERILFKYAIKKADCLVTQSNYQKELLKKNFSRDSIVIKSLHNSPQKKPKKTESPTILWVGAVREVKRPEMFIDIAKDIPYAKFQMIASISDDKSYYKKIKKLALKIPNLDFIGFVPYPKVNQYFEKASIFVCTSLAEGFSNTFLQAWARFVPVVSHTVDPDEIICKYKLGFHSKSFKDMVKNVKLLIDNDKLREKLGENGRKYVEREHDIKMIVKEFENIFQKMYNE